MLRIFVLFVMTASLLITGCSKKKDEVDRLQQEAAEEDAAAVMDSLTRLPRVPDTSAAAASRPSVTERPAQTKPEEPEPEYQVGEGFVVQVGSYSGRELADYWAGRYQTWGYEAYVQTADIAGQTFFRLRIGPFDTYQEAKQIGALLVDRYSADFWVDNSR